MRKRLLIAMHTQRIRDYRTVTQIFQGYYIDPESIMVHIDDLRQAVQ